MIHTTLFEADIAGRIAAKLLGIPSSTSIVNDSYSSSHYRESNRLKLDAARALDAVTATFARKFHAITRSIAESVGPRIGVPQSRIDVVPRGREPQDYPYRSLAARRKVRDELSISASARVVLAVGRHEPQKGLQHLMDALPQIAASLPETVVLLAGKEGRSSPDLRERASLSGLDVRFLGHRTDVADVLSASDVFCFPSEREGFGGALIEAMAVGCPIVASNIPTTREVLSQRDPVGVMTPVGDPDALAHALTHLLTNQAERESMASRARTRFENSYTIDAVTRDMSDFFFGCLATADNKTHARLGTQPSRASSEEPLDRTGR